MRTIVSSRATLVYKFIFVPLWCIAAGGTSIFVALHFSDLVGILIAIGIVLIVLGWVWLMIRNLRMISFDDSYLYVMNFQKEVKFELHRVKAINVPNVGLDLFFEVEVEMPDSRVARFDFMPRFMEQLDFWMNGSLSGTALLLQRRARQLRAEQHLAKQS